jgi:hypothetical protein
VKGQEAIVEFVKDPTRGEIPVHIRRAAREIQDFLPETATTSREVALHVLTSSQDGLSCLYHYWCDRDFKAREKGLDSTGELSLTGVTGVFRKSGDKGPATAGHLRCGCETEASLMYFIWWKTWTLRGPDGMVEAMAPNQLNPRARGVVVQAMEKVTGINASNMYPNEEADYNYEGLVHKRALLRIQLKHVLEGLKKANRGLGLAPLTGEDVMILTSANDGRAPPSM